MFQGWEVNGWQRRRTALGPLTGRRNQERQTKKWIENVKEDGQLYTRQISFEEAKK